MFSATKWKKYADEAHREESSDGSSRYKLPKKSGIVKIS